MLGTIMALYKIGDCEANYATVCFGGRDPKGMNVYSAESHNMGTVEDILVNDAHKPQYFVVRVNSHKAVLLPVDTCSPLIKGDHIYANRLNRSEFSLLLEYRAGQIIRPMQPSEGYQRGSVEQSLPVEVSTAISALATEGTQGQQERSNAEGAARDGQPIELFEERMLIRTQRVKTGEVRISKRTVTETTEAAVPITKEKITIEIESVYGGETRVDIGDAQVAEDGSVHMGIYEEQPVVCRRIAPYQNVSIRKEVVTDTVMTTEPLRKEVLDVSTEGSPSLRWVDAVNG
ncbi:MAG: PRC and DUF2382 domain-containing protein [Cyanobacteria bacterium P01_A01_bin.116]